MQSSQTNPVNVSLHAVEAGCLETVKRQLAAGANPLAEDSLALRLAAANGHLEIVKLLLPLSDPKANASWALRMAALNGYTQIVKLLLPLSDVDVVLNNQNFVSFFHSHGCDLLLSCLTPLRAKEFVADHPTLELPRTRAMLAAQNLRKRPSAHGWLSQARRRS